MLFSDEMGPSRTVKRTLEVLNDRTCPEAKTTCKLNVARVPTKSGCSGAGGAQKSAEKGPFPSQIPKALQPLKGQVSRGKIIKRRKKKNFLDHRCDVKRSEHDSDGKVSPGRIQNPRRVHWNAVHLKLAVTQRRKRKDGFPNQLRNYQLSSHLPHGQH